MFFRRNKKTYILEPLIGVGEVKLGMSREEVWQKMGKPRLTNDKGYLTDYWHGNQFRVYYDKNKKVSGIELGLSWEIGRPRSKAFVAAYKGLNVSETTADEVVRYISKDTDFDQNDPAYPASYMFPKLELGLWREATPEEAVDEEEKKRLSYFQSVMIGGKGYFTADEKKKEVAPYVDWSTAIVSVKNAHISPEDYAKACADTTRLAGPEHVKELYELISHKDFAVREGVAEALIKVEGAKALPALFTALRMGEEDGWDNDSLSTFTLECVEEHKIEAKKFLTKLAKSKSPIDRRNAERALEYTK